MKSETSLLNTITVHIGILIEKELCCKMSLYLGWMGNRWGKQAIMRPWFSLLEKLPVMLDMKFESNNIGYSVFPQLVQMLLREVLRERYWKGEGWIVCSMLPRPHLVLMEISEVSLL